jgi:predicted ATPase/signal transduction histidine kinase
MMNVPGYIFKEEVTAGPGWRMHRATRTRDSAGFLLKISTNDREDQDASTLLLGEHAVLSELRHENILPVTELIQLTDQVALVCEDFAGTPLSRLFDGGPLPVPELLRLAEQLCLLLSFMHESGLVHGLLNPGSLLIERRSMRVQVTNFFLTQPPGLPTAIPPAVSTHHSIVPYIAPEQSGRIERGVDQRSDLYSLGALLYHGLTGWAPFRGTDPLDVIYAHLAREAVPPHQVDPNIPETISRMTMTLLAKDPSDRYQSAALLIDDLRRCLSDLSESGVIGRFPLVTGTDRGIFDIPEQLIGREEEFAILSRAYEISAEGRMTALIVDGYAGVGKSALVMNLLPYILRKNGSFIRGKADQMQRDIPYAALSSAIRDFVTQLLMENRSHLEYWQRRFHDLLQPVAGLVLRLVPEMEFFLDADQEVENIPQSEATNRFREVMRRLFDALSSEQHPLVFFMDDLQWVDNETLQLLSSILKGDRLRHLLFIGAVRGHELNSTHAAQDFITMLEGIHGFEGRITLEALTLDQVNALVAGAMRCSPSHSIPLAEVMFHKTRGNPFFLKQFLSIVHENGLLRFDEHTTMWHWDTEQIERLPHTENVVLLLTQRIQTWPLETQTALATAAYLGNSFALSTIAVARNEEEELLAQELRPALDARLLLPLDKGQRPVFQLPGRNGSDPVYCFLHDRVQQAAYALTPEESRQEMHLNIGRRLLRQIPPSERSKYSFSLADQLNAGRALLQDTAEKSELAELNFTAGMKAVGSVAFASAVSYFRIALDLLDNRWAEEYDLLWAITREIGRAEYTLGNHVSALSFFETLSQRARTPLETAEALAERVHLMNHFGRYNEALAFGREGLAVLGHSLPARITRVHVLAELLLLRISTRGETPETIAQRPEMTDAKARMAVDLLTRLLTAAYFASAETIGFFILKMMRLVVKYGMIDSAAYVFSQYGLILGAGIGRHTEALAYARAGIDIIEHTAYPYWKTRVYLATAAVVNHWTRDARENFAYLEKAVAAAEECGDVLYGLYPRQFHVLTRHFVGDVIDEMLPDIESCIQYAISNELSPDSMRTMRQLYRDLQGRTDAPGRWATPDFHENDTLTALKNSGDSAGVVTYYILRMTSHYLADNHDEAASMRFEAQRHLAASLGQLLHVEYHTFAGLTAAARIRAGNASHAESRIARNSARKLRRFSGLCPVNFEARAKLLEAELESDSLRALSMYESLLEATDSGTTVQIEAIAARSAARRCKALGLLDASKAYARRSVEAFSSWGATRYSDLVFEEFLRDTAASARRNITMPSLRAQSPGLVPITGAFDLAGLMKAATVISGEIQLPVLVEKLLRIMVENAGAEHAALFLEQEGDLRAIARLSSAQSNILHLDALSIEETADVPARIIRYVERTQNQVILDSAVSNEQFSLDEDVARRNVLSVLCMPILYKSRLIGVAYLENNLSQGVFHEGRIEFLQLLSSQIATALENAKLYARLDDARLALEQYSHGLEDKVRERTRALEQRGSELQHALENLQRTQTQLIQAEKMASLGELTAGVAHEIQNPLNFIRNFSELCIELTDEVLASAAIADPDKQPAWKSDLTSLREISGKIHEHGLRIERIVRGMLDHSRKGDIVPSPANVNALIAEALSLSYHGMRAKDDSFSAALETSYDENIPELSLIIPDITRVFINIISNSLFFLSLKHAQGDSAYNPTLSIWSEKKDGIAEFRIRDNGPGIARDALPKVFQPFFTTRPSGMGTGLGLSIAYTIIVEGHGGSMSVDSEEGEWTELTVRLPLS